MTHASSERPAFPWAWATALLIAAIAVLCVPVLRAHSATPALVPSAAILAILGGVFARNLPGFPVAARRGSKQIIRFVIPAAIVLLGAGLDLTQLADPRLGVGGLLTTLACMLVALLASFGAARLLGLNGRTAGLLAAGTAVCGSSAILAVAPVLEAEDDELVVALGTVNLMGLCAMLAVPALAAAFDLHDEAAGVFAGTSVHAVPQAVAAGAAVSDTAAGFATLFKMVRVAMLAPLVLAFGAVIAWRKPNTTGPARTRRIGAIVPWFVWGFLALAALRSFGVLDAALGETSLGDGLQSAGKLLLTYAMVAIGLEIDLRSLLGVGFRGLLAGVIAGTILLAFSLFLATLL